MLQMTFPHTATVIQTDLVAHPEISHFKPAIYTIRDFSSIDFIINYADGTVSVPVPFRAMDINTIAASIGGRLYTIELDTMSLAIKYTGGVVTNVATEINTITLNFKVSPSAKAGLINDYLIELEKLYVLENEQTLGKLAEMYCATVDELFKRTDQLNKTRFYANEIAKFSKGIMEL